MSRINTAASNADEYMKIGRDHIAGANDQLQLAERALMNAAMYQQQLWEEIERLRAELKDAILPNTPEQAT